MRDEGEEDKGIKAWLHVLAGFLIAGILMMVFANTSSCDTFVYELAGHVGVEEAGDQWDKGKQFDKLHLCGTNTKNAADIQVCDEETRGR